MRLGFIEVEATDLVGLAAVAAADGDSLRGAVLLGRAERLLEETGGRWDPVEARVRARAVVEIERNLGREALEAGIAEGRDRAMETLADPTGSGAAQLDGATDR